MNIERYYELQNIIIETEEIFKKWNDKFAFFGTFLSQTTISGNTLDMDELLIPSKELLHEKAKRDVFSLNSWLEINKKLRKVYTVRTEEVLRIIRESDYKELKISDEVLQIRLSPSLDILRLAEIIERYARKGNTLKDFFKNMKDTYLHYASGPSLLIDKEKTFLTIDYLLEDVDRTTLIEKSHLNNLYNMSEEKISELYKLFQRVDLYYEELADFVQRFKEIRKTLLEETAKVYNIHKNTKEYRSVIEKYQ